MVWNLHTFGSSVPKEDRPYGGSSDGRNMSNRIQRLAAFGLCLALSAPVFAAPYTVELTGVGDGANNGTDYYGPYNGTITNSMGQVIYSGYVICDDFLANTSVGVPWQATATNAGSLNGTEKFAGGTYLFGGTLYDTAQMYDAASFLANELLAPANVTNSTAQGDLSFAIWDIFDGTQATLGSATYVDLGAAFAAVGSGFVGDSVEVYTPSPLTASQEILVPIPPTVPTVAEPSSGALCALGLGLVVLGLRRRRAPAV